MFESQNIISEWDIVPLILAAILDDLLGRCPGLRLPDDLSGTFEDIRADQLPAPRVDYKTLTVTLGAGFHSERLLQTRHCCSTVPARPGHLSQSTGASLISRYPGTFPPAG